jgi:hypothetical protein
VRRSAACAKLATDEGAAMFGVDKFQPWTGLDGKYDASNQRVMVIGDTRFDENFTDREIILGKIGGARHLTFTNFQQAVLGKRHWEDGYESAIRTFWERTLFYNYNTNFFPGAERLPPPLEARLDPQNARILGEMLRAYQPTHAIVWGDDNWNSMTAAGAGWVTEPDMRCGGSDEPCRSVTVAGRRTLFTRVKHPSAGFAYERWAPLLARFLAMSV